MRRAVVVGVASLLLIPAVTLFGLALAEGPAGVEVVKRQMIREAARISDLGQATARAWLLRAFSENLTEQMVVDAVNAAMTNNGSNPYVEAFGTIVTSGNDSAIPHGDPNDDAENVLEPGEVVVVDLGARFKGWVSDNTKTYYLGKDPPENYTIRYHLVREAQQLAVKEIRNMARAGDVDGAARNYIEAGGYEIPHCVGHGLGLYVHTPPLICSPDDENRLKTSSNDVVAIEPGIYIEGEFGIRIEDDWAVLRTGSEQYTHAPSEYQESLLSPMNATELPVEITQVPSNPAGSPLLNILIVLSIVVVAAAAFLVITRIRAYRLTRRRHG